MEQRSARTGDLLALGVSRDDLRGPRWRAPFRGVHSPALGAPVTALQRIYDAAELLPAGGVLGGWASAYLLGARELDGAGASGQTVEAVTCVVPRQCHLADRGGVRYFRADLGDEDRVAVDGVPVTSRIRTGFDLARWASLEDGVVALDVMARQTGLDPLAVVGYVREHPRLRRAPAARRAAHLADPGARSTGESRLRVLWLLEAGLPQPVCNAYVVDAVGEVVACTDLLDPRTGMCAEYDGPTHRTLEGHTSDNSREEALEDLGLVVVRATSVDLWRRNRPATARRLQRAHARAALANAGPASWGWRPSPAVPLW